MVKRMITFAMACLILTGSLIFPLGDFSLTRDLPQMYQRYTQITTPDELGVVDFIGDYLLHGKELLGHNGHDKSQNGAGDVQFRHQPVPFFVVLVPLYRTVIILPQPVVKHLATDITASTTDFNSQLFRPPLA